MTTISATVVADSITKEGHRLTTMHLRYPRFIHAESKTHRVINETGEVIEEIVSPGVMNDENLSRNARSSRAVPVPKLIEEVMTDPVVPIHWGKAQKGMQAYEEHDAPILVPTETSIGYEPMSNRDAWLFARDRAVDMAQRFHDAGYHKQIINRLLEPFLHIDTLVTATEWTNFFALRDHHAAEPHIQRLAQEMKSAMAGSTPEPLKPGEWHLPYVDEFRDVPQVLDHVGNSAADEQIYDVLKKLSVARCARISYAPFDGDGKIESELRRYDLLVGSHPLHASPAEHQATPDEYMPCGSYNGGFWRFPKEHGNFVGWRQLRKQLPGECVR